ncbi:UDP-2,4-diacetamido-2,4,6-trideoxy-beta-L-altropyranose hydrolase [Oceanobacillus massiliensis]|uniref:UDP-2,4-diacetamido-2,4, 6-trideoxy-beta-L-altropyranose hydrolase n=1 Tax=Oceanobacillus massiliensis TaxID=1465765 RepID=UPI0030178609
MNICFRVDASTIIGTGHVMRCITLAEELKKNDHNVYFICRLHKGHLSELILRKGFQVFNLDEPTQNRDLLVTKHAPWLGVTLEQDALETQKVVSSNKLQCDWMIVDHYAIDKSWEQSIKSYVPNIMVIDDIADREHDCSILLDQNYYQNANDRYSDLVPSTCRLLLGPQYALLRDEFIKFHNSPKNIKVNKSALIFYGGSDPINETLKAINAIKGKDILAHVVVGPSNPNKEIIKKNCATGNILFHYNINYMAKLMHEVDFALCAGGSTTWERYCVGTPAIVTGVADNQIELCENAQHLGVDHYIGTHDSITQSKIENELELFLEKRDIPLLNKRAKDIVDGHGKSRIIDLLNNI